MTGAADNKETLVELDLDINATHHVRVRDHGRDGGREDLIYDGGATFTFTALPKVRRLGDRWEGTISTADGGFTGTFLVADHTKGHAEYQPGWDHLWVGERYHVELVDALEMAVSVFEVTEGVEISFASEAP